MTSPNEICICGHEEEIHIKGKNSDGSCKAIIGYDNDGEEIFCSCQKFTPKIEKTEVQTICPLGETIPDFTPKIEKTGFSTPNCEICKDYPKEYWCGNPKNKLSLKEQENKDLDNVLAYWKKQAELSRAEKDKLLSSLQEKIEKLNKKHLLDCAEQQLLGWLLGKCGESLWALVKGMGLKEEEWIEIKKFYTPNLDEDEIKEIDEIFKAKDNCEICKDYPKEYWCGNPENKVSTPNEEIIEKVKIKTILRMFPFIEGQTEEERNNLALSWLKRNSSESERIDFALKEVLSLKEQEVSKITDEYYNWMKIATDYEKKYKQLLSSYYKLQDTLLIERNNKNQFLSSLQEKIEEWIKSNKTCWEYLEKHGFPEAKEYGDCIFLNYKLSFPESLSAEEELQKIIKEMGE